MNREIERDVALERGVADGRGLEDYGTALWWTAMILVTMGSA